MPTLVIDSSINDFVRHIYGKSKIMWVLGVWNYTLSAIGLVLEYYQYYDAVGCLV
jgi:hypothetical protein